MPDSLGTSQVSCPKYFSLAPDWVPRRDVDLVRAVAKNLAPHCSLQAHQHGTSLCLQAMLLPGALQLPLVLQIPFAAPVKSRIKGWWVLGKGSRILLQNIRCF